MSDLEHRGRSPHTYVDPDEFSRECEQVFARSWIAVCRHDQIAEAGDVLVADIVGEPVMVVRGRDGVLRAFPNVCRHRNMTIVENSGRCASLQCPYHRWTWSHEGRLLSAPHMDGSPAFAADEQALPSLRIEEWQGWVLVNLDPDALPFGPTVGGLGARCGEVDLGVMVSGPSVTYDCPVNWKVIVENFSESYHHQGVHPDTLHAVYPGHRSWVEDNRGEGWSWLDHVSVDPAIDTFCAVVAFPTLAFSIVRGAGALWFRIQPVAAERTTLEISTLLPPGSPSELADFLVHTAIEVNDEDMPINERTQRGLRSRYAVQGPLSHLEAGLGQFHRWLDDRLAQRWPGTM